MIGLGGLVVIVLASALKVLGFMPSRGRWLRAIKIHNTISFGWQVQPSPQILRHVKEHYGVRGRYFTAKFIAISRQVPPDSFMGVFAGICQRALVDESGPIITQMGAHSRSENGRSAWEALYDTTP
jgi:hypothetical protein